MLVKKLAGVFAMMAVGAFLGAWLACRHFMPDRPTMNAEDALAWATYVAGIFFLVGLFMATVGMGLMQEVLAERRSRELERMFRAKAEYERAIAGDRPPATGATEAPDTK
jgi:hypothetical protein